MAKKWRRSCCHCPADGAVDCGEQPSELDLQVVGGQTVDLFWDWAFGAASVDLEESQSTAPGVWVSVAAGITAADGFYEWVSSFGSGALVTARLRRAGSVESCAVVSNQVMIA